MHKLCVLEVDNTEYKIPEKVIKSYQKLQQENKQLKVEIECFEKSSERKDYNIVEQQEKIVSLQQERDKYKYVVNEVLKYIENNKQYIELEYYCKFGEDYIDVSGILNILKELEGSDK